MNHILYRTYNLGLNTQDYTDRWGEALTLKVTIESTPYLQTL
jgi:hypothetical protein